MLPGKTYPVGPSQLEYPTKTKKVALGPDRTPAVSAAMRDQPATFIAALGAER